MDFADARVAAFDESDLLSQFNVTIRGQVPEERAELTGLEQALFQPAPNALEWCVEPRYLNSPSLYDYHGSYQTIRDYFELRCPICNLTDEHGAPGDLHSGRPGDCWGKTRLELESEVLLVWHNANQEDTCPKCKTPRSQFVEDGLMYNYNQMHLLIGMRAGKSMTAAMMGTYAEHRMLTLAHSYPGGLHGYLGITKAETFEMTFLAASDVQSQDTIWSKYTGFRSNSPWFQKYVPWVKRQVGDQVNLGMRSWRYEEGVKTIRNEHPHVRLVINSLNSNSSSQAGRTRIMALVDELARMKQTEGPQGAAEVYRTQESSLQTIRAHVSEFGGLPWLGSMISVTSPIARDDEAMRLLRRADFITDMYAKKYATWEFNPKQPRHNFIRNYQKDPIGAERDFGANPPGAEHPLIHDERRWLDMVIMRDAHPLATFDYYSRAAPTGDKYVAVRLKACELQITQTPYFIAVDAGHTFDCFSLACGHAEYTYDEQGNEARTTVIDFVARIVPRPDAEVFFPSIVDVVRDLRTRIRLARVEFDRWNSVHPIQAIREFGIPAETHSLKDKDCIDWMVECYTGRVRMLPPAVEDVDVDGDGNWLSPLQFAKDPPLLQPESAAIYELLGLQRDPDSQRVTNPNKGKERGWNSDDSARVIMHVHRMVQKAGYTERHDDRSKRSARRRAEVASASWGERGVIARPNAVAGISSGGGGLRNWSKGRGW